MWGSADTRAAGGVAVARIASHWPRLQDAAGQAQSGHPIN